MTLEIVLNLRLLMGFIGLDDCDVMNTNPRGIDEADAEL